MWNTSTYFRHVVTQSWCAFVFEWVYHNITCVQLSCVWVSPLWPLDQSAAVTVADQNNRTRKDLSSICLFSMLLHITATHNICRPLTEECTLFPHQTKMLVLKESTKSKHFKSCITFITESLIIWTDRHIWVESKPTPQDRRWIHRQWVRCSLWQGMPGFSLLFPHKAAEHFPLSCAYSVTGKCDCRMVGTPQPAFLQQTMA